MTTAPTSARAWLTIKQLAIKRAEAIGLPTQEQEDWRYVHVAPMAKPPLTAPTPVMSATIKPFMIPGCAATLVLVNGAYREDLSQLSTDHALSAANLFALPDAEAAALAERWAEELEQTLDVTACWSLSDLNGGLRLKARGQVAGAVHILDVAAGGCHASRIVAHVAEGSAIDMIISRVEIAASRSVMGFELFLDAGAVARVDELQYAATGQAAQAYALQWCRLQRDASVTWTSLSSGGELARMRMDASIDGAGAQVAARGLTLLDDKRQAHQHVRVQHQVGNTTSSQLYKTIADGESLASFDGLVSIAKGADQANAEQRNNNLLLSPKARVGTRPQLDILDDDVKASHGATVGQLNEDEVFYLRTRGLPASQAVALLTKGFADEIVELMTSKAAREMARGKILRQFA